MSYTYPDDEEIGRRKEVTLLASKYVFSLRYRPNLRFALVPTHPLVRAFDHNVAEIIRMIFESYANARSGVNMRGQRITELRAAIDDTCRELYGRHINPPAEFGIAASYVREAIPRAEIVYKSQHRLSVARKVAVD